MFFEGDVADASFYKDEMLESRLEAMLEAIDVKRMKAADGRPLRDGRRPRLDDGQDRDPRSGRHARGHERRADGRREPRRRAGVDRAALEVAGIEQAEIVRTVSTGYGRRLVAIADQSFTEITCHARGAATCGPACGS